MGTASRKTWLERQTNEVQVGVLSMDEAGRTLEEMRAVLKERFDLEVPASTLANSLKQWNEGPGKEEKLAALFADQMGALFAAHPNLDPRLLAKGFITLRLKEARTGKIGADSLLDLAQGEARLALRERELAAKEEANRIKREALEIDRKRIELMERKLPKVKQEVEKALSDEKRSPQEVKRRVEEIFGIFEPAVGGGAADALPEGVGGR